MKFEGVDMLTQSHVQRARILATVPQEHVPPFPYTVFEVVLMGRASRIGTLATPSRQDSASGGRGPGGGRDRDAEGQSLYQAERGEKQLVLIARALAQDAPVMLLDEPVSHLDFRHQLLILRKIRRLVRDKDLVALMTLHDPNLAIQFSDRVVLMASGSVVSAGSPETVITEESLKHVYGIDVRVISWNGFRIVHPEGDA